MNSSFFKDNKILDGSELTNLMAGKKKLILLGKNKGPSQMIISNANINASVKYDTNKQYKIAHLIYCSPMYHAILNVIFIF